ncbi:MAG: ABC transporter permease [Rhizobiales bacterium]|nr:ABC transporter permease [Hyphomicrobiales bacterium]
MTWYLPSKFLGMFVTLVLASIISFAAIELPQGSYLSSYRAQLQASDVSAEQIEGELRYIEERFALSQPVYTRYFTWISGLVRGDLGYSLALRQPVAELLGDRLANSLSLALATTIFTLIVGMGIGTIAAVFPYSIWDNTLTLLVFFFLAVPNFLLAIVFMYVSITFFGVAPQFGLQSPEYVFAPWDLARVWDFVAHLWLPVIIIGSANAAGMIRVVRARMLEVLPEPYIATARSKGVAESAVVLLHAMRVAVNPVVSATALALPTIIGGEIVPSIVLQLNTLGPLLLEALLAQDMYLAATILLIMTAVLVLANFVADIIISLLDPRISK